jgi:hypothetical protein
MDLTRTAGPFGREYWDSLTREEKLALIRERRAEKWQFKRIASAYGVHIGTLRSIFYDPDGETRARLRASWAGVCESCGRPTFGEGGKKSRFCKGCYKHPKKWTRETIIEAIQRWNREYGHPPVSTDWLRAGEWWPSRTQVYGFHRFGEKKYPNPFPKWADAIEAAGFPRPQVGIKYNYTPRNTK